MQNEQFRALIRATAEDKRNPTNGVICYYVSPYEKEGRADNCIAGKIFKACGATDGQLSDQEGAVAEVAAFRLFPGLFTDEQLHTLRELQEYADARNGERTHFEVVQAYEAGEIS